MSQFINLTELNNNTL